MSGAAADDARWMAAAIALSQRGRGRSAPNPCVGCVIVADGRAVGRGFTQPGGRPHAEAVALAQAGGRARGATAYVTLEPCAAPGRGPACSGELIRAGIGRVVAGIGDPFPAVDGAGFAALRAAGISVTIGPGAEAAERAMAGFLMRLRAGRPLVTLKLALSLDGAVAMADGRSKWVTGPEARAHGHLERSRHEAIVVGRGTWEADAPRLDVRLAGLERRSPRRHVLSGAHARAGTRAPAAPAGVEILAGPDDIGRLEGVDHLLVEGGARTAAAFLRADLVDRLLLYRAPVLVGGGRTLPDIGLADLGDAHGRWALVDRRLLGSDVLEDYERRRACSPASSPTSAR